MRALAYRRYGGPEVLEHLDLPIPQPIAGRALVKVAAASINPVDWKLRRGLLRFAMRGGFPKVFGSDLAGTVVAAPGGGFREGDRVFGFAPPNRAPGSIADFCLVPLDRLAPIPEGMGMAEAAALPCVGATAWQGLTEVGGLKSGQRVLVNGCAGGVGHVAAQIAVHAGAEVTGTCRTRSIDFAHGLGVHHVVDYTAASILDASWPFDLVFETASALSYARARRIMAARSVYLDPDLQVWNLAWGWGGRRYRPVFADIRRPVLDRLAALFVEGVIRPRAGLVAPFDEAARVVGDIEAGRSINGKTVFLL